jgi:hypothetical protein
MPWIALRRATGLCLSTQVTKDEGHAVAATRTATRGAARRVGEMQFSADRNVEVRELTRCAEVPSGDHRKAVR